MHIYPGPVGLAWIRWARDPGPGWRVGRCAACFFSLIFFLMLFCFPGSFGDVVSRFQQLRQRTPCGGYGAGGEGGVSGVNSPEK